MFSLLLALIYVSFISLGLPDSLLGSAWPQMQESLGVSLSLGGVISFLITASTILSSLVSHQVIQRFGTGAVTMCSVALTALALFGFSLSNSFFALCLWAIPYGLGAGSVDAALNNFVALHCKAKHMSWLHCFWGIGATG
ncbi:MFS transporter, partial [Anaerotignum lactatifermentans]